MDEVYLIMQQNYINIIEEYQIDIIICFKFQIIIKYDFGPIVIIFCTLYQ